jgi:hypothetical protein
MSLVIIPRDAVRDSEPFFAAMTEEKAQRIVAAGKPPRYVEKPGDRRWGKYAVVDRPEAERCRHCDRANCPWWSMPDGDDSDNDLFSAERVNAEADCHRHKLTADEWRSRALAAEADSARLRERERALVAGLREAAGLLDGEDIDPDGDHAARLRALADAQPPAAPVDTGEHETP